ncbi:hypothetical protein EGW08_022910 [Elysia chlorotica]|uniref:Uncharacterized protein n=1 Tax=Elysia chlorotica TaxID=188477 RepID=A0A3S0Z4P8_ELYCH|nr:hypothetical protein EGW08_022910 [Elysia chlorotica]
MVAFYQSTKTVVNQYPVSRLRSERKFGPWACCLRGRLSPGRRPKPRPTTSGGTASNSFWPSTKSLPDGTRIFSTGATRLNTSLSSLITRRKRRTYPCVGQKSWNNSGRRGVRNQRLRPPPRGTWSMLSTWWREHPARPMEDSSLTSTSWRQTWLLGARKFLLS